MLKTTAWPLGRRMRLNSLNTAPMSGTTSHCVSEVTLMPSLSPLPMVLGEALLP